MKTEHYILAGLLVWLIGEALSIFNKRKRDEISFLIRKAARRYMILTFACGLLMGHWFWPLTDSIGCIDAFPTCEECIERELKNDEQSEQDKSSSTGGGGAAVPGGWEVRYGGRSLHRGEWADDLPGITISISNTFVFSEPEPGGEPQPLTYVGTTFPDPYAASFTYGYPTSDPAAFAFTDPYSYSPSSALRHYASVRQRRRHTDTGLRALVRRVDRRRTRRGPPRPLHGR